MPWCMTLVVCLGVSVAGCGETSSGDADDAVVAEAIVNSPLCPDDPATIRTFPVSCGPGAPDGLACRYRAFACAPGERPDNICHCVGQGSNQGFVCEGHLRTCLPLAENGLLAFGARRIPEHRPNADPCSDPATLPRDAVCPVGDRDAPALCTTNGTCGDEEVCLLEHVFGNRSRCACHAAECLVDGDCREDELCDCGVTDNSIKCGGPYRVTPCAHRCVPAECRVDADCGPGGWCSPSPNECHSAVTVWACHLPARDECLSDDECAFSADGAICQFADGAWRCRSGPLCD